MRLKSRRETDKDDRLLQVRSNVQLEVAISSGRLQRDYSCVSLELKIKLIEGQKKLQIKATGLNGGRKGKNSLFLVKNNFHRFQPDVEKRIDDKKYFYCDRCVHDYGRLFCHEKHSIATKHRHLWDSQKQDGTDCFWTKLFARCFPLGCSLDAHRMESTQVFLWWNFNLEGFCCFW